MGYIYSIADDSGGGGSATTDSVANFAALPPAADETGFIWFVENAQGTQWLPGNLGGNYYPRGAYYSNGTEWIFQNSAAEATQSEVDTGVVTDKFVSPGTLAATPKITNSFQKNIDDTDDITEGVKTFVPALPSDNTKYLDGEGNFTTPAGGGGGATFGDIWAANTLNNC